MHNFVKWVPWVLRLFKILLWSCIVYRVELVLFDFSNHLVSRICPILMKTIKISNNYKWCILIVEEGRETLKIKQKKYETKGLINFLIEMWPISYLSSVPHWNSQKIKKISNCSCWHKDVFVKVLPQIPYNCQPD